MAFDIKQYKFDFIAIATFIVLSIAFCFPQFNGKKLSQHDNISWQGMVHEGMEYHKNTGTDVLWTNAMFGGMPSYTIASFADNHNYVAPIQSFLQAVGKPAYFFLIAMVCFYLLMRVLKVNHWLAVIGSVAYAFSTYNPVIIGAGHETKMLTMGYIPAAIAGLYLIYQNRWIVGAAVWSTSLALMAMNNHFQVIYYYLFIFVAFGIVMLVKAIKEADFKNFAIASAIAVVTGIIGVGPAMPSILTTAEYSKATMRGGASELAEHDKKTSGGLDKEYAFRWSNGIGETFVLMIPYLYGGGSSEAADKAPKTKEAVGDRADHLPLYWGSQPFVSGPVYFGAVICFLFVLGLMVVRSQHKWWILGASLFGIILSFGKNMPGINYFLFDHLPMLNKFRTPSMALVIPQFLFPMLGIWGLNEIYEQRNELAKIEDKLKMAVGMTAGLCVLLGVGGSIFFNFTGAGDEQMQPELVKLLKEDRASLAMTSALKSAAYILIAGGLIWAYLRDKIKATPMLAGIGLIVAIDLIPVSFSYLNEEKYEDADAYESVFKPRKVDEMIMQDKDPYYRVLDLSRDTYNDAIQCYFHKCVGGYSPAKMESYQDMIDRHLGKNGFNSEVLNMLNTKYIIVGGQRSEPQVMPNQNACGNAWFVDEIKWAATAEEEISGLNAPRLGDTASTPGSFKATKTAVVRNTFKDAVGNYTFGKDSAASVKLSKYGLDEISFESHNSKDGFAVFSDIYYDKGWKATIDGKDAPIIKANYILRALKVPAGNHKIEFVFHPDSFYNGQKYALISSILILLLCGTAVAATFKKPQAA